MSYLLNQPHPIPARLGPASALMYNNNIWFIVYKTQLLVLGLRPLRRIRFGVELF